MMTLVSAHQREPANRIARWVREQEEDPNATPEQLVNVAFALRVEPDRVRYEAADALVRRLYDRFPTHPDVRLIRANEHALAGEWAEARACLEGLAPNDFDPSRAQHLHHLRAFAAFEEGRFEEMANEVSAARGFDGHCELETLEQMAQREGAGDTTPLGQLVTLLHEADACFERGDQAGAAALLDRPLVWAARELQSLARLSEALLHTEAASHVERVRKLVVLGTLLREKDEGRPGDTREILFPGAWSAARIADVADRARAWLDALLEVREPSRRAS
jgi:tetratricopeptide (TPR) repeat protein